MIWHHTRHERTAVELVRFLLSKDAQIGYCQKIGYLPTRLEALDGQLYSTDPILSGFVKALKVGRLFPLMKLGGLVESRLATALYQIWGEVIANPLIDLESTIQRNFEPLVRRVENWVV